MMLANHGDSGRPLWALRIFFSAASPYDRILLFLTVLVQNFLFLIHSDIYNATQTNYIKTILLTLIINNHIFDTK